MHTAFPNQHILALLCLLAAGALHAHAEGPVGFASVAAHGLEGTTGGGDSAPVIVRTALEFQSAVERRDVRSKRARDETPRVVVVDGEIDLGELGNLRPGSQLTSVGIVYPRNHTTILGRGPDATIRHGTIEVHGANDIIIRGLRFRDLWEPDPTDAFDDLGWDYISITNSGQALAHHVWIDHCDFEKVYDGMVDITHGSDLVTISWCRFAGDARGPQKKVCLIGASSGPSSVSRDTGRLNITLHHNWFVDIDERTPRARFGNIHAFNNLIEGAQCATISVTGAVTLVEGNVYRDTRIATSFSHAADAVSKGRGGTLCLVDSLNLEPRNPPPPSTDDARFEQEHNFRSSVERAALRFNPPADWTWSDLQGLPYAYEADPVSTVAERVRAAAGPVGLVDR